MMEDDRYEWRKQNNPDFVASAASGGSSSNSHEAGNDDEGAYDLICDAALEMRRKRRLEMKNNTHNKLEMLVDVAARLEFVEGELAKVADGKAPDDKLLTGAVWEVVKQRSAEKGQKAREKAERDYEERTQKWDQQDFYKSKLGLTSKLPLRVPLWLGTSIQPRVWASSTQCTMHHPTRTRIFP